MAGERAAAPLVGRRASSGTPGEPRGRERHGRRRVRAMVLYPTNALVEDQISRLRKALITRAARASAPHVLLRPLHRRDARRRDAPDAQQQTSARADSRRAAAQDGARPRRDGRPTTSSCISQFSDPRVGELLTRWDMIAAPPDILVTNYSMLNVMLMREREDPIFDADSRVAARRRTARVHARRRRAPHLPRHAGSEVALVVRNLLRRLGLDPRLAAAALHRHERVARRERGARVPRAVLRRRRRQPSRSPPASPRRCQSQPSHSRARRLRA